MTNWKLTGGPRDGEIVETIPEDYVAVKNESDLQSVAVWKPDHEEMNRLIRESGYASE